VYEALKRTGLRTIVVWPCSDQGYRDVLRALGEYERSPQFVTRKNIEAVDYWGLMAGASVMVGNSSSGLMETPYFDLPSVTVGHRQDGRARDSNVIAVPEVSPERVTEAIERALSRDFKTGLVNHHVFGRGNAGERIAEILRSVELGETLLRKKITF
jgi:UDP-N-acetylglucosamine 2-epimerase